jgi:putative peptidoglycan lipid II flippase
VALRAQQWERIGLMAAMLAASAVIYFAALWAGGVKLRQFAAR